MVDEGWQSEGMGGFRAEDMVQCLLLPTPGTDDDFDVLDIRPCVASCSWVQGSAGGRTDSRTHACVRSHTR